MMDMSVLDKEIYRLRNEEVNLDDFTKPKRRLIEGSKKDVDNYLFYILSILENKKNTCGEIFVYNILVQIYTELKKVYDEKLMMSIKWFMQQVLKPNRGFRIPLIGISKYIVKKKIYEEYEILSDYILSNVERRPFINTPLYDNDMYIERIIDYVTLSYELAVGEIYEINKIRELVESKASKFYIYHELGKMICNKEQSVLFKSYILSKPEIEFGFKDKWKEDTYLYIGMFSIQFTKFMLNDPDSDDLCDRLIAFLI